MSDSGTTASEVSFTPEEKKEIQKHVAKYPDAKSAVMPVLWIAQEKFGWLSPEVMKLVASELGLSYAHVHGVASFYTMYFKKKVPKYLFDICTCFTCGECGGEEMLQHAKKVLNVDENGYSEDGMFWVRTAECLAACDTAPVMQVANRRVVHNLDSKNLEQVIEDLRKGKEPGYEPIPLTDQSGKGKGHARISTPDQPVEDQNEAPDSENNSNENKEDNN